MLQFLSIFFLLDFFNFCWVFQKFPFFVSSCIRMSPVILAYVLKKKKERERKKKRAGRQS